MKTSQDTRSISSEEWSKLHQSTRRQAHELRRDMIENMWRGSVAAIQATLMSAYRRVQHLADFAHRDTNKLAGPPAA